MAAIFTALFVGALIGFFVGKISGDQQLMDAVEDAKDKADDAYEEMYKMRKAAKKREGHVLERPIWLPARSSQTGWTPTRKNNRGRLGEWSPSKLMPSISPVL